ncbi:MAG: YfhO family protein [Lactobacillales bacterium]|jgi:hypothetical protein|nr:YfhO family protein [Lactobacillales bacterium]
MLVRKSKLSKFVDQHFSLAATLLFVLLSVLIYLPVILSGKFPYGNDGLFHLSRLYELVLGVENGKIFPDISAFTLGERMGGVNFFYPYISVYPIAILMYFLGDFYGFVIGLMVVRFFLLFVSYWMMYKFSASKKKSLIFSLVYSFSIYTLVNQIQRGALGETLGMVFLPMAVYGIYQILFEDYKEWIWAVLGIIGILYSHVLSVFMLFVVAVGAMLFLLIKKREIVNKKRVLSWLKAGLVICLLSAIFLIPFIEQMKFSHAFATTCYNLSTDTFSFFLKGSLQNSLEFPPGQRGILGFFYTLIIVIITYFFVKCEAFTVKLKILGILTLFFIVLGTSLFPWFLLQNTFFNTIQFTWRWFIFVSLFSSAYIAEGMMCLLDHDSKKFQFLKWVPIFLSLNGLIICSAFFYLRISDGYAHSINTKMFTRNSNNSQLFNKHNGKYDYATRRQKKLGKKNGNAIFVDGKKTELKLKHKNYEFYVDDLSSTEKKVTLPITWLKGMSAYDDKGKLLHVNWKVDGYPIVRTKSKVIRIIYRKTIVQKMSILVSGISWLLFLVMIRCKSFVKRGGRLKVEKFKEKL